MEECLCAGKSAPLPTTLPWWKLALSVCLHHACSLFIRCNCLLQASNMACNHLFGRGIRIQQVDIVKKNPLFLLCLAQVVLVFQLWFASCRQAMACNWRCKCQFKKRLACLGSKPTFPRLQSSCGPCHPFSQRIWQMFHQLFHPCMSKNPCRSYPSHTNAETMHFGHNMPGIEIITFFSFCFQLFVLLCHFLASLWQLLKLIAFHIGVGFGHKPG